MSSQKPGLLQSSQLSIPFIGSPKVGEPTSCGILQAERGRQHSLVRAQGGPPAGRRGDCEHGQLWSCRGVDGSEAGCGLPSHRPGPCPTGIVGLGLLSQRFMI